MGFTIAKTQPLAMTQQLHGKTATLDDQIKAALQQLDPKQVDALIKEMQAKNPHLAQMLERLADAVFQQTSQQMTLGDINGKGKGHGAHHHPHHEASQFAQTAQLHQLLDDIKRKQEMTPNPDSSTGAQSNAQQQEFERKHYTDTLTLSNAQAG